MELTPAHIFDCPAIIADIIKIEFFFSKMNLYVDNIVEITKAVISAHGTIKLVLDTTSSLQIVCLLAPP